jgi:predicted transcriptional regulator
MNAKSNVVPLRQKAERESEKKWGRAVMDLGYSMIPSLIFRAQARLGLSPTQLVVLLHLADYWWHRAQMPFPSKAALAERMGLSDRQIQRYLTELENGGFIERVERFAGHKGQQSNEYNMSGLVDKLKKLEPDFRQVREQAKEQARNVAKPGGLQRIKKKVSESKDE